MCVGACQGGCRPPTCGMLRILSAGVCVRETQARVRGRGRAHTGTGARARATRAGICTHANKILYYRAVWAWRRMGTLAAVRRLDG